MASTAAGAQLTRSHRRRQLAIRAALLADVWEIVAAVDIERLDATWPVAQPALVATTRTHHQISALAAEEYYRQFRVAEAIPGPAPTIQRAAFDTVKVTASIEYVGRIRTERGLTVGRTNPTGRLLVSVAGSATRLALEGGRTTLGNAIAVDNQARGWQRVTGPDPCDFCQMLADRGPVYTKASGSMVGFARDGRRRWSTGPRARQVGESYHDHCACTVEPVFT